MLFAAKSDFMCSMRGRFVAICKVAQTQLPTPVVSQVGVTHWKAVTGMKQWCSGAGLSILKENIQEQMPSVALASD